MTGLLHRALDVVATRIKGEPYQIDPRVGGGYLVGLARRRVLMKVRGFLRFPTRSPFVGAGVSIRARGSLRLGRGVTFADRSSVDALSVDGVWLGDNTSLGPYTRIECTGNLRTLGRGFVAGNNVGLGSDCLYGAAGGIEIGDDTIIGNFVSFHSENHVADDRDRPIRLQGVTHRGIRVGRGCWIGAKVTILDGAEIGDGVIVAAGAVLPAGVYESESIYGGVPARLLKRR